MKKTNYFNNPFINKINFGLTYEADLQFAFNTKRFASISAQFNRIPYTININRSYNSAGYWKPTTGYLNLIYTTPQFYLCYNEQIFKRDNFQLFGTVGLTDMSNPYFKFINSSVTLYDGTKVDTTFSKKANGDFVQDLHSVDASVRLGCKAYYNNFCLAVFIDQGIKNAFSGKYKEHHNDGQDFNIYSQSITAQFGYRLRRNKRQD